MAIGDMIPTEMIPPTALSTTATAVFTNTSASFRAHLTGLLLCNTGASSRIITIYKNGLVPANQILNSITLPANTSTIIDFTGKALVFTGVQTLGAKQDAGTDVNIAAYGIIEQIS